MTSSWCCWIINMLRLHEAALSKFSSFLFVIVMTSFNSDSLLLQAVWEKHWPRGTSSPSACAEASRHRFHLLYSFRGKDRWSPVGKVNYLKFNAVWLKDIKTKNSYALVWTRLRNCSCSNGSLSSSRPLPIPSESSFRIWCQRWRLQRRHTTAHILKGVWDEYLVKSVFNAPVPAYCLAQALALSAHAERKRKGK